MAFELFGIPLPVPTMRSTAMIVVRNDYSAEKSAVVFADPRKLRPYLESFRLSSFTDPARERSERGIRQACTNTPAERPINPSENPLPMSYVCCYHLAGNKRPSVSFMDGQTRALVLIENGAPFVPLQVPIDQAAMLHSVVGGDKPPQPATSFVVPPEQAKRLSVSYYEKYFTGVREGRFRMGDEMPPPEAL